MKAFLDTEFNSFKGDPISLGIVAEDGREFYLELPLPTDIHPWVQTHVVPLLDGTMTTENMNQIASMLGHWLCTIDDGDLEIIADWPEDFSHLCNLLCIPGGNRFGPDTFQMRLRRDIGSEGSEIPHHALHDARALRAAYNSLQNQSAT